MKSTIERELERLSSLSVPALKREFERAWGEPARSNNRVYLIKRTAWRIQAVAQGGLTERARRRAEAIARDEDLRVRPPAEVHEALRGLRASNWTTWPSGSSGSRAGRARSSRTRPPRRSSMSRIRTRLLRLERQAARRPECPECSLESGNMVFTVMPPRILGEPEPPEPDLPPPTPCRACGRVREPLVFTVRAPRAIGVGGDQ